MSGRTQAASHHSCAFAADLACAGCAAAQPASAATLPNDIKWVQRSAEYYAATLEAYRDATARVEQQASTRKAGTWAVILDADETVISNLQYQIERIGQGYSAESWAAWVHRKEAIPLPGAAAFLARVRQLGGRIAIVTNRLESECEDTRAVFRTHQLPFDAMLCRPDKAPSDKNPRFEVGRDGEDASRPGAARRRRLRRRQHPRLPGTDPGHPSGRGRGVLRVRGALLPGAEPDVRQLGTIGRESTQAPLEPGIRESRPDPSRCTWSQRQCRSSRRAEHRWQLSV